MKLEFHHLSIPDTSTMIFCYFKRCCFEVIVVAAHIRTCAPYIWSTLCRYGIAGLWFKSRSHTWLNWKHNSSRNLTMRTNWDLIGLQTRSLQRSNCKGSQIFIETHQQLRHISINSSFVGPVWIWLLMMGILLTFRGHHRCVSWVLRSIRRTDDS